MSRSNSIVIILLAVFAVENVLAPKQLAIDGVLAAAIALRNKHCGDDSGNSNSGVVGIGTAAVVTAAVAAAGAACGACSSDFGAYEKSQRAPHPYRRPVRSPHPYSRPCEPSNQTCAASSNGPAAHASTANANAFQSNDSPYSDVEPEMMDVDEEELDSVHSDSENEWGDDEQYASDDVDEGAEADVVDTAYTAPKRPPMKKLWCKQEQFPSGYDGALSYDMNNLFAAQRWE
eukprot:6214759-Pleurochrysis_carterae.AAC.1